MLSNELQIGKAGEHLVCCDLISRGYNAFLADQGLPYDVVMDYNNILYRIQVKTTTVFQRNKGKEDVLRFTMRNGKFARNKLKLNHTDFFAFVYLPAKEIAYINSNELVKDDGYLKQCIEFKSNKRDYQRRTYCNGSTRRLWGRIFENYLEIEQALFTEKLKGVI
jgi:hypothetical protein